MLLGDPSQRGKFSNAGIGENDIDSALCLDGLVETIEVGEFGNVSLNAANVAADCLHSLVEFLPATPGDEDIGTLPDEELCRGEPYASSATGDDRYFSL